MKELKKWTEIPSGQTNGAFQRLMVSLGEQAEVAVTRINTEPTFVERLAEYAINGCIVPNASHDGAREIMGKNFFGIPEAIKHFGFNPTRRELAMLSEIPFTPEELMTRRDTHILAVVFPISIIEIREKFSYKFFQIDCQKNEKFPYIRGEVGWQLISKNPVENSSNKNWREQQALISPEEEVPTLPTMVYIIIGHFLQTGERLFTGNIYLRTSTVDDNGDHVSVSGLANKGIDIGGSWDNSREGNVLLAVAKK